MTEDIRDDRADGTGHLGPLRLDALRLGQGTDFEYAHLRACAECRDGVALLRRLAHELAPAARAPFEIPVERRQALLANAARALPRKTATPRERARRYLVPAALAATLVGGVVIGRWYSTGTSAPHFSAPNVASDVAGPRAAANRTSESVSQRATAEGPASVQANDASAATTSVASGPVAPRKWKTLQARPVPIPADARLVITGAGSTFPEPLYDEWFEAFRGRGSNAHFLYQGSGSSYGLGKLHGGKLDFANIDDLSLDVAGLVYVPTVMNAVVMIQHQNQAPVMLSGKLLAQIFLGKIRRWSEIGGPDIPIVVVHRSDVAAASAVLNDYLCRVSPEWSWERCRSRGPLVRWPVGLGAEGDEGVADLVERTPGAIGYVLFDFAARNRLRTLPIQNAAGRYVPASPASMSEAADGLPPSEFRPGLLMNRGGPDAYAIAYCSYVVTRKDFPSRERVDALARFLWWATHEGQATAARLGYVPLPPAALSAAEVAVRSIAPWLESWSGEAPPTTTAPPAGGTIADQRGGAPWTSSSANEPNSVRVGVPPGAAGLQGVPAAPTVPDQASWSSSGRQVIKLATILPDGAPGTTELKDAASAIKKASGDKVEIKLYLGVSGDEKDIVKKLKIGQLQAAHLTGLGLAEIAPEIHVLDLPFFFSDYRQVDNVYSNILSYFQAAFRTKGFEFLGFTETGFVYLYSNRKIESLADLQRATVWAAEGDPLTAAFVAEAEMRAVPLGIPDVLQSLETGLIDTVYGPPSGMIGLQWFTKVKYVQTVPFVHATGGIVMSKKAYDSLPPDQQESLQRTMAQQTKLITASLRKVNEDSKAEIKKSGVQDLPKPSPEFWQQFKDISNRVTEREAGQIYSKPLLDKVRALRDQASRY